MIQSEDILDKIEKQEGELQADEVIKNIYHILNVIRDQKVSTWKPDMLMDYVYSLQKFMFNLGDLKSDAYAIVEALKAEYDSSVDNHYLKLKNGTEKISDKMAETIAKQENEERLQELIVAKRKADKLKELHNACKVQINLTQTKIRTMDDDRVGTNIATN